MTRHIFKLVWNRKRSTGLIMVEILICFLVLCGILASCLHYLGLWQRPLGFDHEDVWVADIGGMSWQQVEDDESAVNGQTMSNLLRAVKSLPEVEAVAASTNQPYSGSSWLDRIWIDGKPAALQLTMTTPGLMDVFHIELLFGRWLDDTDAAMNYTPVVISHNLARDMFGTDDPIGQDMPTFDDNGNPITATDAETTSEEDAKIYRIVGVTSVYLRYGEFGPRPYTMFIPVDLISGDELPHGIVIRAQPGTTAAFEEKLVRTMQSIAPQWSYDTELIESRRRGVLFEKIGPLLTVAVVALFLIFMVGLGLVGVLWLSVTRRTAELGLRRAMGASGASVRRQILGELWALTAIAVVVGAVIFLQLPLFGANFGASWRVFFGGLTLATLVIYGFVTFCGLYPTWLATRIQPATALQYE